MQNKSLAKDYISRSIKRLKAIETLMHEEDWADVVRESQEVVELSLKALLRTFHIEAPRIHDVSEILLQETGRFPEKLRAHFEKFVGISRSLRRDRELAFYGSEDLTPSEFYKKADAKEAFEKASFIVETVKDYIK